MRIRMQGCVDGRPCPVVWALEWVLSAPCQRTAPRGGEGEGAADTSPYPEPAAGLPLGRLSRAGRGKQGFPD